MKQYLILAAIAAAFAINASAKSTEESYIAQYAGRTDIPHPIKVVSPTVAENDNGKVKVQFKVSNSGSVHAVSVVEKAGTVNSFAVIQAVRAWRFEPKAGQTGDVDVALTINVPAS